MSFTSFPNHRTAILPECTPKTMEEKQNKNTNIKYQITSKPPSPIESTTLPLLRSDAHFELKLIHFQFRKVWKKVENFICSTRGFIYQLTTNNAYYSKIQFPTYLITWTLEFLRLFTAVCFVVSVSALKKYELEIGLYPKKLCLKTSAKMKLIIPGLFHHKQDSFQYIHPIGIEIDPLDKMDIQPRPIYLDNLRQTI